MKQLDSLRLDLVGLKAARVRVDGEKRTSFRQSNRRLTVTPPAPIAAGQEFRVSVRYSGSPGPRTSRWGQVGWEHLEDGILVASQPVGAPTWYPCNDRPSDKARYRIELTLEEGYTVAATGRTGVLRLVVGKGHLDVRRRPAHRQLPRGPVHRAVPVGGTGAGGRARHGLLPRGRSAAGF